jgi:hypothetical protein
MDIALYEQEVKKLSNDLSSIEHEQDSSISSSNPLNRMWKYKQYFLLIIGSFLSLYVIKPKVILKIIAKESTTPTMVIDPKKFIIWWSVLVVAGVLSLFIFAKLKKR